MKFSCLAPPSHSKLSEFSEAREAGRSRVGQTGFESRPRRRALVVGPRTAPSPMLCLSVSARRMGVKGGHGVYSKIK